MIGFAYGSYDENHTEFNFRDGYWCERPYKGGIVGSGILAKGEFTKFSFNFKGTMDQVGLTGYRLNDGFAETPSQEVNYDSLDSLIEAEGASSTFLAEFSSYRCSPPPPDDGPRIFGPPAKNPR